MSVTSTEAHAALKTRLSSGLSFTVYWQGDAIPILPDTPATFAYAVFDVEGSGYATTAYGGGRGNNLYRNSALLSVYTFSPDGAGASVVLAAAETVAALLRSYRDAYVSCFSADVILIGPGSAMSVPGLSNEVSNYQCAVAEVSLYFDTIG